MDNKKTYSASVVCSNCHEHFNVDIPFGVTIEVHTKNMVCPHCGCVKVGESLENVIRSNNGRHG